MFRIMFRSVIVVGLIAHAASAAPSGLTKIVHTGTNDPTTENGYPIKNAAPNNQPWGVSSAGGVSIGAENAGWKVDTTVGNPNNANEHFYVLLPTATDTAAANTHGWVLTGTVELTGSPEFGGIRMTYVSGGGGPPGPIWNILFGTDGSGNAVVGSDTGSLATYNVGSAGYHTYQLVHGPGTGGSATLYVDGLAAITNIVGINSLGFSQVLFGDASSGPDGHANFSLVEWNLPEPTGLASLAISTGIVALKRHARRSNVSATV